MNLYRIDRITHNDVRNMAEYIGVSTATFVWAIDLLRERLVPVEPDLDAAMDAWFFLAGQDFKLQLAGALNAYIRGPITETPCDCDELVPGICDGGPHRIKRGIQGKKSV